MAQFHRRGFTLVELIVVLLMIAIVIAMLLPAVRKVSTSAARSKCENNLKQVMMALHAYHDAHGKFPTGCIGPEGAPQDRNSWMVEILPYIDESALHKQFDPNASYAVNNAPAQKRIPSFICPENTQDLTNSPITTYIAMSGLGANAAEQPKGTPGNGFMGYDRITSCMTITDGASNVVVVMETRLNLGPWARGGTSTLRGYDPTDLPIFGDNRQFAGHEKGMNVAMADGHVRFVRSTVDPKALAKCISINDGDGGNLD